MSQTAAKLLFPLVKPILPYLTLLPPSILTLPPSVILHYTSHPSPSLTNLLKSPTTHPIHLPLIITTCLMLVLFPLGLVSRNVSWVDRIWTFWPVVCSALVLVWAGVNPNGAVYGHNLPRLAVMLGLQVLWSIRLTSHALRRGFLDIFSQDYRYTTVKKIIPWYLFQAIHLFVIVLFQPPLLLALSLPLHSLLVVPPTELSSGPIPSLSLPYSAFLPFLPERFHSAPPSTPVLNVTDLFLVILSLAILYTEMKADNQMFEYQEAKHSAIKSNSSASTMVRPKSTSSGSSSNLPQATAYPANYHPGFPTKGLFAIVRHANFASEQLFWVVQALFVALAGESSGVTKSGWVIGSVFGPCFVLSLLFCASTALTEWITARKYPAYKSYSRLVGQFLPQETAIIYVLGKLFGKREKARREVYGPVSGKKD